MNFNPSNPPQRLDYFMFLPLRIAQHEPIHTLLFP